MSGPGAFCRGLCRGPAALFRRCLCRGPALCVRARHSLFQSPALLASGARRSLCWGPVLSVESRRRGAAVLSQDSIFQVPAVCVSGLALFVCLSRPNDLCLVVSGRGTLSVAARRSLRRGPARTCALSIGLGARRSSALSVSGPGTLRRSLCVGTRRSVSGPVGSLYVGPARQSVSGPNPAPRAPSSLFPGDALLFGGKCSV